MAISSSGIISGLNVDSIVSGLMAMEKLPLQRLQTKKTTVGSQISAMGKIKSSIAANANIMTVKNESITNIQIEMNVSSIFLGRVSRALLNDNFSVDLNAQHTTHTSIPIIIFI